METRIAPGYPSSNRATTIVIAADVFERETKHIREKIPENIITLASLLTKSYITQRDAGYWIEETRVSLESVVYSFLNGESPESIADNFPLLSLEQVYGAIAFYLANRDLVDAYLQAGEADFKQLQQRCRNESPLLY